MGTTQKWILSILAGAFIGLWAGIYAQADNEPANEPTEVEEKTRGGMVDIELNNFEEAEDWRAYATSPLGDTKIKKSVQLGKIDDPQNPGNLTDKETTDFVEGQNHVLGVKTYFVDRGFDRVEVKPPHEYIIQGIGKQVSVWVLGRQYRHTLYIKLRDYRGNIHKIRLGRLDFFGWRKMTVPVPGWVPQSTRFALYNKNLHFVSLFVVSDSHEVPGTFYFYVDNLFMKVDRSEMDYPGSLIKDTW